MSELKNLWLRQDVTGRIMLLSGTALSIQNLLQGRGMAAVILMVFVVIFCPVHAWARERRRYRDYGQLYYILPDGEEVALLLRDVEKRHLGREFILRCPYDGINADGDWDTGFGLVLDMSGCEVYPKLRRGERMEIRGILAGEAGNYYLAVHSCIRL